MLRRLNFFPYTYSNHLKTENWTNFNVKNCKFYVITFIKGSSFSASSQKLIANSLLQCILYLLGIKVKSFRLLASSYWPLAEKTAIVIDAACSLG